jgi:ABC-2 type transport system ATP-binding protein
MSTVLDAAVAVRNIVKRFGDFTAVDGISFSVAPGEIFGLLGPNGAGKSTLIRMMVTLMPPTAGTAVINGFDVTRQADQVRRSIGVIPQAMTTDLELSVEENLLIFAKLYGVSRDKRAQLIPELLAAVELTQWADKPVKNLSGGMRRRVEIARGLVHEPRIFFLDEPTTGLDPQSRAALWDDVSRLSLDGVTVFLTTQYLEEADVLADRVGIIDHGRIVAEGTPAALKAEVGRPTVEVVPADRGQRDAVSEVLSRFGEPAQASPDGIAVMIDGEAELAPIVRALDAEELHVEKLQLHAPTLDDVFLAHTGRSLEGSEEPEAVVAE